MEKPIKEWYKELPQPFQLQANYNFDFHPGPYGDAKFDKLRFSISRGFVWEETSEGSDYWEKVSYIVGDSNELDSYQIEKLKKLATEYENKTSDEGGKQKPIPRMVNVRDYEDHSWRERELMADLSNFDLQNPFIVCEATSPSIVVGYKHMREIETKPMKFSEFCQNNADEPDLDVIYESYQHYLGFFKKVGDE